MNMEEEEINTSSWSRTHVCSCRNKGEPWEKDGLTYTSRDPSCRVHRTVLSSGTIPLSAETIVGNWKDLEKNK
jgi:hypothetical protein